MGKFEYRIFFTAKGFSSQSKSVTAITGYALLGGHWKFNPSTEGDFTVLVVPRLEFWGIESIIILAVCFLTGGGGEMKSGR